MKKNPLHYSVFLPLLITLAASSLTVNAATFDFTAAEGFEGSPSAALDGQQGWTATAGILVNIDPEKEFLFVAGGSGQNAQHGLSSFNPQEGTVTCVQEFRFNFDQATTKDLYNVFRLDSDTPGDISRLFIHYGGGNFRLRYSTGNGWDRDLRSSIGFPPSEIGLEGDSSSDRLRLTWVLRRGLSASEWSYTATLENLDTGTTIIVWKVKDVVVRDSFHNDTSIVPGFSTTAKLSATYVELFSVESTALSFWDDATQMGDDLLALGWLGEFFAFSDAEDGYLYHLQHGWLAYLGNNADDFYVYDVALGHWTHFDNTSYPWIYIYGDSETSGWNYFLGGMLEERTFYNVVTDSIWPA